MKAYQLKSTDRKRVCPVDLGYRYELPEVACDACGEVWGEWAVEYPAFNFEFLRERIFSGKNRVVSVEGFEGIRRRIITAAGRSLMVLPGASIGTLSGTTVSTKLDDFVWGRIVLPQISKRACDILRNDGIELTTTNCEIRRGRQRIDSHLAIQVEPVEMLTDGCLNRARIGYCAVCGNYSCSPLSPDITGSYELRQSAWPQGKHLVQVAETKEVVVSAEFIAAVKKHGFVGIAFEEYGEFVTGGHPVRRTNKPPPLPAPSIESLRAQCEELNRRNKLARIEFIIDDQPEQSCAETNSATREQAVRIAKLLDSKVKPHDVIVLGESNRPFAVPLKLKDFKGNVFVGDTDHSVELKHRKGEKAFREDALFCVSFKSRYRTMFTKERVAVVSKELGVPVYRQSFIDDETVAKYLLCDPVRAVLAKIDFKPVTKLFLNPIQLEVSSKLKDPAACAAQVRAFVELMESLACARKPEKPQPKRKR